MITPVLDQAPVGALDPDLDYVVHNLTKERIEQAMTIGNMRSKENANTWQKPGYRNKFAAHKNTDNDALGVAFELAVTEALGFNPDDSTVITLFKTKPYGVDTPDIKGIYECRRLNDCKGAPTKGVTWYNKDITNSAYIVTGSVAHRCDPVNKRIEILGPVTIYGWNYLLIDYKHIATYMYDRGVMAGGNIKRFRMRPLHTLPMLDGAAWNKTAVWE